MGTTASVPQSISATWAFVVVVDSSGHITLVDHEFVTEVKAKRVASYDDIYAASFLASKEDHFAWMRPGDGVYSHAFLVFQVPDGRIAASPNVFDNVIPVTSPSNAQVLGAFGVLQGQIIVQKTLEAFMAQAAMSAAMMNQAEGKSAGGLYVA